MENKMVAAKTAISAFFTAAAALLGWQGIMIVVWVAVMLIDYLSGTFAAWKAGDWCSKTAREGVWHKGGMIVVVAVSGIADLIMHVICENLPVGIPWTSLIMPLVLAWYIITELGSILENAVKMGAKVPAWLVKLLRSSVKAIDTVGDGAAEEVQEALPEVSPEE